MCLRGFSFSDLYSKKTSMKLCLVAVAKILLLPNIPHSYYLVPFAISLNMYLKNVFIELLHILTF